MASGTTTTSEASDTGNAGGSAATGAAAAETDEATDITGRPIALRTIDLDTFFRPRRVAVVGASDTNARPNTALTQKITTWAEERGATVYYVNPNRPTSRRAPGRQGADRHQRASSTWWPSWSGEPLPILQDAMAAKAKFAVVFAAGFAEVGAKGEKIQARDGGDHRQRRAPRARAQHQPQRLRGLPRRPARPGHRPHHPERPPGPARSSRARRSASGCRTGRRPATRPTSSRPTSSTTSPSLPDDRRRRLLHRGVQERAHPAAGRRRTPHGARCPSWPSRWAAPTRARPWPRPTPAT